MCRATAFVDQRAQVAQRGSGPAACCDQRGKHIAGHLMRQADINQDEQLTRDEWTGFLATVDSDTDGQLSFSELQAVRPEDAPERPERFEGQEPPAIDVSHQRSLAQSLF